MSSSSPKLWIVAGEASGDTRGAELLRELKKQSPQIRLIGSGGPKMAALCDSPYDNWIEQAGVLGLWDVLRHYPYFRKKFNQTLTGIAHEKPDAIILIDYPGFNLRLAKALRKKHPSLKIIYYISPQVWAWNRRRIPVMAATLDLMICIFPFEKTLYENSGLKTEFAGHPLAEELPALDKTPSIAQRDPHLLAFLPGSRDREIHRLFPVMLATAQRILKSRPEIHFAAAAAREDQRQWMQEQADALKLPLQVSTHTAHKLMQTASVGIVCSGTATLESAFYGLPYCLVYKVNWLTWEVGRRLVKIPFLGIINILAQRPLVREFIQQNCTPAQLADESLRLLNSQEAREKLSRDLQATTAQLGGPGAATRAATAILKET